MKTGLIGLKIKNLALMVGNTLRPLITSYNVLNGIILAQIIVIIWQTSIPIEFVVKVVNHKFKHTLIYVKRCFYLHIILFPFYGHYDPTTLLPGLFN